MRKMCIKIPEGQKVRRLCLSTLEGLKPRKMCLKRVDSVVTGAALDAVIEFELN